MKVLIRSYIGDPPFPGKGEVLELEIPTNSCTIAQLLEDLGISVDELGLFFVNQQRVTKDYVLEEGDVVVLLPLLEGG